MIKNKEVKSKPTTGYIVISSYIPQTKYGYYQIFNIENKNRIQQKFFYDVEMSDNLVSFLGICAALREIPKEHNITIYSSNQAAIGWVEKNNCKTKFYTLDTNRLIQEASHFLGNIGKINCIGWWQAKWGKAHDFIYSDIF